jgi:hypothetical protein
MLNAVIPVSDYEPKSDKKKPRKKNAEPKRMNFSNFLNAAKSFKENE